jgi:hypothetical protein
MSLALEPRPFWLRLISAECRSNDPNRVVYRDTGQGLNFGAKGRMTLS